MMSCHWVIVVPDILRLHSGLRILRNNYTVMQHHIPEEHKPQLLHCKNLKSCKANIILTFPYPANVENMVSF